MMTLIANGIADLCISLLLAAFMIVNDAAQAQWRVSLSIAAMIAAIAAAANIGMLLP